MNKPKKTQEMVREVRQRAEQALKLCDEAEHGKVTAEEFEKRLSKVLIDEVFGPWQIPHSRS